MNKIIKLLISILLLTGCSSNTITEKTNIQEDTISQKELKTTLSNIPSYTNEASVTINDDEPDFTEYEISQATVSYEYYSDLDALGRCGYAMASISEDIMPTEERGSINDVKPSGWYNEAYTCIDGGWVYNRCHLLGFQLTGENDNEKNLITGTRYMNVDGMLPYENWIADFVKSTDYHVLYKVTPIYEGDNLIASGVHMEAQSVEDGGAGLKFNIYCFNVQPGVHIDYTNGQSSATDACPIKGSTQTTEYVYVAGSGNGNKYHSNSHCSRMQNAQKITLEEAKAQGYTPCSRCFD